MIFKKLFPKSLYKRFIIIIALPIIIIQLVSFCVFYYNHLAAVNKNLGQMNAAEIKFIIKNYKKLQLNNLLTTILQDLNINVKPVKSDSKHLANIKKVIYPYQKFREQLSIAGINLINIKKTSNKAIAMIIQYQDQFFKIDMATKKITPSRVNIFIFWLICTSLTLLFISIIFVKNQIKFLKQLKDSAEKYGRGLVDENIRPSGSEEIRSLGLSFIRMRDRIKRQVTQRTEMLSGVSHDLRTPLTRIKLQLEMLPKSKAINELKVDIEDMENLIEEYLEFAKTENIEKPTNILISEFLQNQIINPYLRRGKNINTSIDLGDKICAEFKIISLKRALNNLLDNAFNFADIVDFKTRKSNRNLIITIEDNGPGIPLKERNNVLKPFYQIDNSRNLDKKSSNNYKSKGSGLGLAIANDNISSQGGRIKLSKSQLGGLKVIIYLPL